MQTPSKKRALSVMTTTLLFVMAILTINANAGVKVVKQDFSSEPHAIIQETTIKVLAALENGPNPEKEPEKFVAELSVILDPVVAFNYIAKGVMGNYAKQVSKQQVEQFSQSFRLGLVNTYGKGMSGFGDYEVAIFPPEKPLGDQRRIAVVQEIRGESVNQVSYSMAKNKQGQWKMINVVLNGVNLGQTFRGQFAAAVEKNNGDVNKTINEWDKS